MLDKVLTQPRPPVQIAFFQGAIPLQAGACFEKLLDALRGPRGDSGFAAEAGRGGGRGGRGGGARKKEQVAWRRMGSSWLGRRVVLEPADGAAPVAATVDGYRPPAETKVRLDPHGPYVPFFRALLTTRRSASARTSTRRTSSTRRPRRSRRASRRPTTRSARRRRPSAAPHASGP